MSEFGHFGRISGVFCIDAWGAGPFVITHQDKSYRFEDSDRFGPVLLNKNGEPSERQPGERSPFWDVHSLWRKQGRRLEEDGTTCIFDVLALKPTFYRKIGGQNFIIEDGDEGGEFIEVE